MANSNGRPRTHEERNRWPLRVDLTFKDCETEKFSGLRKVEITGDMEIWFVGRRVRIISEVEMKMNPNAIEDAMNELVGN